LHRLDEVYVPYFHDQVNGIEVFLAAEASSEIGLWVHGGVEISAIRAEESKSIFGLL